MKNMPIGVKLGPINVRKIESNNIPVEGDKVLEGLRFIFYSVIGQWLSSCFFIESFRSDIKLTVTPN